MVLEEIPARQLFGDSFLGGICSCAKSPGDNCRGDNFKEIIV